MKLRRRFVMRCIVAMVIVAGVVGWLILRSQTSHLADSEDAERDATRVARTAMPKILGYTDSNLATQITTNRTVMTSDYAKRYDAMVRARVLPQAKKYGVANQVKVVSAAVVRARPSRAVILIFANQTTSTKAQPRGVTQGTRLEVTMQRHGSTWLVDNIKPL